MGGEVQPRPGPTASHSTPSLTAPVRQCPNVPANSRQSGPRAPLAVSYPAISLTTATVGRHRHPQKRLQTAADPASTRIRAPTIHVCYFLSPLPVSSPRPSLSIGGFGLRCDDCKTPVRELGCPAPEDSNDKNYWQNLRCIWNPVEASTGIHTALFSITTTAWGVERIIPSRKVKRSLISDLMEFFPASKAAKMIAPFGNPSL